MGEEGKGLGPLAFNLGKGKLRLWLSKHSKPHKLVKGQSSVRFLTKQVLLKAAMAHLAGPNSVAFSPLNIYQQERKSRL